MILLVPSVVNTDKWNNHEYLQEDDIQYTQYLHFTHNSLGGGHGVSKPLSFKYATIKISDNIIIIKAAI